MIALYQEPWCFTPDEVAGLTDQQIMQGYINPAIERSKRFQQDSPSAPADYTPSVDAPLASSPATESPRQPQQPLPGSPEFRAWVIGKFIVMGMSHKAAEAKYEHQAKKWTGRTE